MSLTKICIRGASQALGVKRVAYVLTGVLGLSVVASQVAAVPVASAATFNHTRGYSVQHGWLCYGWGDGSLHCTQAWHRSSSGQAISENPAWVPNTGTSGGNTYFVGLALNTTSTTTSTASHTGRVSPSAARSVSPKISAWASTGRAAYAMHDFAGDPNHGTFGSCTWYAWYRHQNEPLLRLGNAAQWAYSARSHGLATGSAPSAGATVVFQGGVQGASGLGHVGHVEAVYGGGWFLLSEMSFTWNGGGWGRVSYRYAHTGAGVSFIY